MKHSAVIKSIKQTHDNALEIEVEDGVKFTVTLVVEPSDSDEDLFLRISSDRQLKIDFQVRPKC